VIVWYVDPAVHKHALACFVNGRLQFVTFVDTRLPLACRPDRLVIERMRIYPDGSLDTSFNPGSDNEVNDVAVQPDGKILVCGGFTQLGGQPRNNIGRINPDGSLDDSFNPGTNDAVFALAVQPKS